MKARELTGRLWPAVVVLLFSSQLLPQEALASSSDSGTLTPAQVGSGCYTYVGYYVLQGWGSYSPTGLTGPKTLTGLWDQIGCSGAGSPSARPSSSLFVGGFTSSPGAGWLISITCNGVEHLASDALFFWGLVGPYNEATWTWPQLFGFGNGAQVSCTIVHN
jgi:hypothetical protein